MSVFFRTGSILLLLLVLGWFQAAGEIDLRDSLLPERIDVVRIQLDPGGVDLGFETEIAGNDDRLSSLLALIRQADPGGDHKCPNVGKIRFFLLDGSGIGVGLLPSHAKGLYGFRLYDGDRLVGAYRLKRASLLTALAALGVPTTHFAFRE